MADEEAGMLAGEEAGEPEVAADWWPDLLQALATADPWRDEMVTVAEMAGFDDGGTPGQRILWSALVRPEDLAALDGNLRAFNHEVESTGRPGPGSAGTLEPRFHITAYADGRRIVCEPLVLGWINANQTAMVLDPGFCTTYGLMPRTLGDGSTHWDDPAAPRFDVAVIDRPSIYENLRVSHARARVSRAHLQDYLTLRGRHLVQVYFEHRTGARDAAAERFLAGADRSQAKLIDREIDVIRNHDGSIAVQVWGARLIAGPGDLPITADGLEMTGLAWPGFPNPVTHGIARRLRPFDHIYVRDSVLAAYEGRPGFSVHPESGSVSFGNQWSIGHCARVGRDVIRVELKKLYEGVPDREIRHWHSHAIAPSSDLEGRPAFEARNVASRTRELVLVLTSVGERLAALNAVLKLPDRTGADFVGLDRAFLDFNGWWNGPFVDPVARHIPIDMDRSNFLNRCLALDKLAVEAFAQGKLRPVVRALGVTDPQLDSWKGLKLLDRIACFAQIAVAAGLNIAGAGTEIAVRLQRDGTEPTQPLSRLFAVSDLRQLEGHRKDGVDRRIEQAIERFGVDAGSAVAGWGGTLDAIYDGAIEDLAALDRTLAEAQDLAAL